MFRVQQYNVCPQTGVTDFLIHFDIGSGIKTDKKAYYDQQDADKYIQKMKWDYIRIMFQHFINHSQILIDIGNRDFYKTPARLEAMDKCKRANKWFYDEMVPLKTICEWILKLEEDLTLILPAPANKSRQSSEDKLRDMIVFARQHSDFKVNRKEPVKI